MMETKIVGDPAQFAVSYAFVEDSRETEISMFVENQNILAFKREDQIYTTRWNLDELAFWLRDFLDHMAEDPYPVDVPGDYAAMKDNNAREFDSDDEEELDAYYEMLYEWNLRHRWHTASSGAILSDVYFQLVGDDVEISWNNEDMDEEAEFVQQLGGTKVKKDLFISVVDSFLKDYANHWFG